MLLPAAYHLGGPQLSTLGTGAGQAGFGPHNFLSFKKAYGLWGAWGTTILIRRRRQWHPTPVLLPGESKGWGSLVGRRLWGRTESDMTEAT